jgi:hypothetical protein
MKTSKKALSAAAYKAYLMTWGGNYYSTAYYPELTKEQRFFYLPDNKYVENWEPVEFTLKGERYDDYQSATHGFRLFSERFRELIDTHKTPEDKFQWLDVSVTFHKETRPYFALHFYECDDIIDEQKSTWNDNIEPRGFIFPAFKRDIVAKHGIFSTGYSGDIPYVTGIMRKIILDAKMTGLVFEKSCVVD